MAGVYLVLGCAKYISGPAVLVDLYKFPIVVSRTRAENQMETCGVHLGGTLFLPAQGQTPRVPVKAAKGSCAERSQTSSFIHAGSKQASYKSGSFSYLCIALGSGGTFACLLFIRTICLSPVDKLTSADNVVSLPLSI